MIIRQAEPRDVSKVEKLFHELLKYLVDCGQWLYAKDQNKLENGVIDFIVGKMCDQRSFVLVAENGDSEVCGFLIGGLLQYPPFFEHTVLGEIQWLYPLSVKESPTFVRDISRAFEVWARSLGATAGCNYCFPTNRAARKLMEYDGRRHVFEIFFKPYGREVEKS